MDIKRIDIKEFRESGYLQEVNRKFLHPLGLALEVEIDDDGVEKLGGVWDFRDDEEGMYYDIKNSDDTRFKKFTKNKEFVDNELETRSSVRSEKLGFIIEEIKK